MATLREYLKNLQEEYKPQPPTPIDEETEQKAEAYDYLTGRTESETAE
jgi:hypothetical protein